MNGMGGQLAPEYTYKEGIIGFSSYNMRRRGLFFFMDFNGNFIDSLTIPNIYFQDIWDRCSFTDNPFLIDYNRNHDRFVIAKRHSDDLFIIDAHGNICNRIGGYIQKPVAKSKIAMCFSYGVSLWNDTTTMPLTCNGSGL